MVFEVGDLLITIDGEISQVVERTKPLDTDRPYKVEYRLNIILPSGEGFSMSRGETYWAESKDINRYYKKLDKSHTAWVLFGNGKT